MFHKGWKTSFTAPFCLLASWRRHQRLLLRAVMGGGRQQQQLLRVVVGGRRLRQQRWWPGSHISATPNLRHRSIFTSLAKNACKLYMSLEGILVPSLNHLPEVLEHVF